ncbi:c-type cytochrome [Thiohalomonas denitrificans]|nr:c-type cytochrome [Thiohalomonas denitrificans]
MSETVGCDKVNTRGRMRRYLQTLSWLLLVVAIGLGVHFTIQFITKGGSAHSGESPALPKILELENSSPEQARKARAGMRKYDAICRLCHHRDGHGGRFTPSLAGKSAIGVETMLNLYRDGQKVGPMTELMAPWAKELSDEEIRNLGIYIELLD